MSATNDKDDMNLLTLLEDLKELKCKVMLLGLHLKVPKENIEVFEKEHTKDYDRIFIEVLDFWLENCKGNKRKCLCEAVSHVGSTALKEKIQEKYGESERSINHSKRKRSNEGDILDEPDCKQPKTMTGDTTDEPDNKQRKCMDALEKATTSGDRQALMELVTQPSYHLYTLHNGGTLLHIASRKGHLNVVKTLIEVFGCQLDITDEFGNTPYHSACAAGQLIIMDYYYPYLNNFTPTNDSGDTLLHLACKSGSVPMVRWVFVSLLSKKCRFQGYIKISEYYDEVFSVLINESGLKTHLNLDHEIFFQKNKVGYTPLHLACSLRRIDIVKFYLHEVRNFFDEDLSEFLPSVMHLAYCTKIMKYISPGIAKKYIFSCSSCNTPGNFGERQNFKQIFQPRQVMQPDKCRLSHSVMSEPILFYAARCGDLDFVKAHSINNALLYSLKNEFADTLLHAACVSGNTELIKFVYEALKTGNHGIKNAENIFGNTCLHLTCEWGSSELVKYLLEEGFIVNAKNSLGQTPLHLSVLHDRKEIFDCLLNDQKIDMHAKNKYGETPLHIAASRHTCIEYVMH